MKFKVHRVRFVDHKPQAIHCLAFEDVKFRPRLALSRADSSIEIWCPRYNWSQQLIIPGCSDTSVESLVWCGNRLFSGGLHGGITEWDLGRLAPKAISGSLGGAVWSLAVNHAKTHLAAGCEDGSTRLFEILPDGGLLYVRSLDKQENRILSLSWHVSDKILVTGSSDSTVRIYNIKTGQCTLRITMEEFETRSTLIWNVYITKNFTIITGDSLGNTQFWDGKTGTLVESYKAHKADVLSFCINEGEDTLFSSGVDSNVVRFKLTERPGHKPKWFKTTAMRMHTHDVRALAILDSKDLLVSGGVDTNLGVYSLSKFTEASHRRISSFPQHPIISLASDVNILMYQWHGSLQFWRLGSTDKDSTVLQSHPLQLLQINAKGDNHVMCSAVSSCSKWVAYSDIEHISLFSVSMTSESKENFKVSRVLPLPPDLLPAQRMCFTKDVTMLVCATNQHSIQILDLNDEITLNTTLHLPGNEKDLPAMRLLAVSDDGKWTACVDSKNAVNVFNIKSAKHHSTLPTFDSHVTAMAFQPGTQFLAIVCADKQVYIYNTSESKLTDWSKQSSNNGLPKEWTRRYSKIVNVAFSPLDADLMLLQDHEIFTVINLKKPLPDPDIVLFKKSQQDANRKRTASSSLDEKAKGAKEDGKGKQKNKKKKGGKKKDQEEEECKDSSEDSFKICQKYESLLYTGFVQDGSLVVVERPWMKVLESLPPTLYRKRYGKC